MTTVLFDTCIVLDLMQKREPFFENAHKLFVAVANHRIRGCLTARSVLDIYYLMHRANHSVEGTRKQLSALFSLFWILDTTAVDCKQALLSGIADYEDAVTAETAVREKIDCFVTRNSGDYKNVSFRVLSPEDLLRRMTEDN